ncbi:DEAD/DEAH box helicase family protein [Marinisporobacter balticus]|uniref:Type I restriction and modification enzyme subunit R-like protein n=1 Tax=Marinisporobacter balticus TaxID=2018667 RepID=A0A4R2L3Y8_9FIRM|nr:DEAD/DEAH box helicase family protein [Marinisporobacter balticus]TCO73845.1 type I restriction and modification enzyme subunit R-like protein [Marinisporobacter balticus]
MEGINEKEWETRKKRIDKKLSKDWCIVKYSSGLDCSGLSNHAVTEYPTATGSADYVFFVNGKLVAALEAKKVSTNPQEVLGQAKRYSRSVKNTIGNWSGYKIPLLYSSNGEIIWFLDKRDISNIRRKIQALHTPNAMMEILNKDENISFRKLTSTPIKQNKKLREYQAQAIDDTEKALVQHKRNMLVAMATGTGKTFLTVSQIYRLLDSKAFKRILFLVDRKALAAQAVRTFASFDTPKGLKFDKEFEVYSQAFKKDDFGEDEPFNAKLLPNEYLTNPSEQHTFVYVCTIQRMAINCRFSN